MNTNTADLALRTAYCAAHGLTLYLRMRGPIGWAVHDARTDETLDGGESQETALRVAEYRLQKRRQER